MATKKIETLVPKVKREAPSCPDFIAIEELRNSLIDFCINTDIYMQNLEALQLAKNINEYDVTDLTIPTGTEMNHLIDIFRDNSGSGVPIVSEKTYSRLEPKSQIGGITVIMAEAQPDITHKEISPLFYLPLPRTKQRRFMFYIV